MVSTSYIVLFLIQLLVKCIFNFDNSNQMINWINRNFNILTITEVVFGFIIGIIFYLGKKIEFLSTNREVIRKRVEDKYKK